MKRSITRESGYQSRIRASVNRLVCWGGVWVGTCALMAFGPKFLWHKALVFTLLAAGLNVAVGFGMILANKTYIMELDELQRKIYLNALAIAVGVALIVSIPCSVLDRYHMIPFHADLTLLWVLLSLTFVVSCVYGSWRYR